MYIPQKFKIVDPEEIKAFIRKNSFGLILSVNNDVIHDTHTPFILSEDGLLLGHIAKANPQWENWNLDVQGKVIFTGPHAYISPLSYESEFSVPTWNYTAVSITGKISIIDEEARVADFLHKLVSQYEDKDSGWKLDETDERYMKLMSGIVVFSVSIDLVEASFKMSQNKSIADQESVIKSLSKGGCPIKHEVASLMKDINTNRT